MLFALLIALFLLCLYGIHFTVRGFHEDFLSKEKTNSIKGIFILLIVLSHSLQYIEGSSYLFDCFGDNAFTWFFSHLGQMVVVMFLFYSGYGVGESSKYKGLSYVNSMPRRRILTTLINFDVAVIAFILLKVVLGHTISIKQALLSLTGWESVGNSNWYIFVILLCYLFTYISLRLRLPRRGYSIVLLFTLCFATIAALSLFKGHWWYDTILCYPLGFLFSSYKKPVIGCFKKYYWAVGAVLLILFVGLYVCPRDLWRLFYNTMSMTFALLVILFTMKMGINNRPLQWVGSHLFPIYIYMRLPMIFIKDKGISLIEFHPALFIIISLVVTLIIAHFYRFWKIKLN